MNRYFSKGDIQKSNKYMFLIGLLLAIIKETKIRTLIMHHFIPSRVARIKKTMTNLGEDVEKL